MFGSIIPTILLDINEKSAKLTKENLPGDKYVIFEGTKDVAK